LTPALIAGVETGNEAGCDGKRCGFIGDFDGVGDFDGNEGVVGVELFADAPVIGQAGRLPYGIQVSVYMKLEIVLHCYVVELQRLVVLHPCYKFETRVTLLNTNCLRCYIKDIVAMGRSRDNRSLTVAAQFE
jgi:hypothetical protein